MIKAANKYNILIQYLIWHFFDVPKEIVKAWRNFLLFNLNYFSVFLLFKTLFSPWRKYQWSYGRGFDFARYFEVLFSNLISRILGAIIRTILIFFALTIEIFIFFGGLIVFIGWLILPIILLAGIFFSLKIIF